MNEYNIIGQLKELEKELKDLGLHAQGSQLWDLIHELEVACGTALSIKMYIARQERGENPFGDLKQFLSWTHARAATVVWQLNGKE